MPPITPEEVDKSRVIPEIVFECFNQLIQLNHSRGSAIVKQKDVEKLLLKNGITKKRMSEENLLDVEESYRKAGWEVEYDKPSYDENYPARFIFRNKK